MNGQPALDGDGNFRIDETSIQIYGIDLELPLVEGELFNFVLYADEVFIKDAGNGFHTGFRGAAGLPFASQSLRYQAEYRLLDSDYIPSYFDGFYDVQQFQFPDGDSSVTKVQALGSLSSGGPKSSSAFLEAAWDLGQTASLGLNFQDTFRDDNNLSKQLGIFGKLDISKYAVSAAYLKKNFGTVSEAFTVDDRSLLTVNATYRVSKYVSLLLTVTNRFEVNQDTQEVQSLRTYAVMFSLNF